MFLSFVILIALSSGPASPKIEARTGYASPSEAYAYAVQAEGRLESEARSPLPQSPWVAPDFRVRKRAETMCPVFNVNDQAGEELYFLALLCGDAGNFLKAKLALQRYFASPVQAHAPKARLWLALCQMMTGTSDDAWQTMRMVLQNDPIDEGEYMSARSLIEDQSRTSEEKALQWSQERYAALLRRAQNAVPESSRVSYQWVVLAGADLVHRYWLCGDASKAESTLTELNTIAEAHRAEIQGWSVQQLQWANMEMKPAPAIPTMKLFGIAPGHDVIQRGRVQVVSFFFLGCVPCVAELPTLNDLQKRYPRETLLVTDATTYEANVHSGTSSHQAIENALNQVRRKKAPDITMIITSQETIENYHVIAFPVVVVIDKAGRARYVGHDTSFQEDDPVGRLINQLVRE